MYAQMKFFYILRTRENKRKRDECIALDVSQISQIIEKYITDL